MPDQTYVYSLTIAASAQQVWAALTENDFWQQYWGGEWRVESDWQPGSPVTFYTREGKFFSRGEVVQSLPPKTLTYTWPNPEEEDSTAPPEKLTWEITSSGSQGVTLKLIHEHLTEQYFLGVSKGWPIILGNLKVLLETGKMPA